MNICRQYFALIAVFVLGIIGFSGAASAQTVSQAEFEEVQRSLRERDVVIADLLQRMDLLEKELSLLKVQPSKSVTGTDVNGNSVVARSKIGSTNSPDTSQLSPGVTATSLVAPSPQGPSKEADASGQSVAEQTTTSTAQNESAPGSVEVSEDDELERALERTLVSEGALLLPFGKAEIQPTFAYTRVEDTVPAFFTQGGNTFIAERNRRRDEFQFDVGLRIGLPFDSQLELGIPYNIVDQENIIQVLGTPVDNNTETGYGFGDFRVGLAKTLVREGTWYPDVVGRVTWDTATGDKTDNGVGLGSGFDEIRGAFSLTKRQDPLAFVGGLFYETTLEDDDIDPGDEWGITVGTVLAASPETSVRFLFQQSFSDEVEVDGDKIDGTDQTSGIFTIGASSVLGPGTLLDLGVGLGVTDDAPDYSIFVSLPIRFDTPILSP